MTNVAQKRQQLPFQRNKSLIAQLKCVLLIIRLLMQIKAKNLYKTNIIRVFLKVEYIIGKLMEFSILWCKNRIILLNRLKIIHV